MVRVDAEQISLILGQNFVFSFQEGKEGDVFGPLRDRIRNGKGRIRKMGADYLAYSLIDAIVDHYFIILEKLGERIESLEEALVAQPTTETLKEIHSLKREMIFLAKGGLASAGGDQQPEQRGISIDPGVHPDLSQGCL